MENFLTKEFYNILFPIDIGIVIIWIIFELKTHTFLLLFKPEESLSKRLPQINLPLLVWALISLFFGFLFIYFSIYGLIHNLGIFDVLGYFPVLGPILVTEGIILLLMKIKMNIEQKKRLIGYATIFVIISILILQFIFVFFMESVFLPF